MTTLSTDNPPLWPGLALLAGAAVLASLAACASTLAELPVPAALDAGPQARALATLSATGVQIYECRAEPGANAPAWAFVAPEADLFDQRGRPAGSHGAGPHWLSLDGSRIVGSVKSRADAPQAGAIPWLLLTTRSTAGSGTFSTVTQIQRLRTEGGVAPTSGCTAGTQGQRTRVPYRADYRLFTSA